MPVWAGGGGGGEIAQIRTEVGGRVRVAGLRSFAIAERRGRWGWRWCQSRSLGSAGPRQGFSTCACGGVGTGDGEHDMVASRDGWLRWKTIIVMYLVVAMVLRCPLWSERFCNHLLRNTRSIDDLGSCCVGCAGIVAIFTEIQVLAMQVAQGLRFLSWQLSSRKLTEMGNGEGTQILADQPR